MGRGIRFTTEFNREAVRLVLSSPAGRGQRSSEDLGVELVIADTLDRSISR